MGRSVLVDEVLYACISNFLDEVFFLKQLLLLLPCGAPIKFLMNVLSSFIFLFLH